MLVAAENPVLVADRLARTPNGMKLLVELAETLQAGVIDQGSRMNFPSRHPLNQTQRARAAVAEADVIVGLEVADFWATVNALRDQLHRSTRRVAKPTAKLITITTGDLYIRANYQDFRRLQDVDLAIAADGEATLPSLIDAVKRLTTARSQARVRGARREARGGQPRGGRSAPAWRRPTPGTRARSASRACRAELWAQIKNDDWSLVSSYYSNDQATGRGGSGTSTSRISGSATPAAAASATARPRRSAARSPTASTAGCRSPSRPTAT